MVGKRVFIVVGAVSIVGAFPNPPPGLAISNDIDIFPPPDGDGEINETLARHFGEGSAFALERGFHIEGVGRWTMMMGLPGWEDRLITTRTPGDVLGLCLSPIDLAYVKLEVARDKDINYVGVMIRENVVTRDAIMKATTCLRDDLRERIEANLCKAEQARGIRI